MTVPPLSPGTVRVVDEVRDDRCCERTLAVPSSSEDWLAGPSGTSVDFRVWKATHVFSSGRLVFHASAP